jgi:hypothetical protein
MSAAESSSAPSSWPGSPRARLGADAMLLAVGALTLLACLITINRTLRISLVLASACVLPGGALATRLRVTDGLEALVIAVTLGFCVQALGAMVMAFSGWWHPFAWGLTLLIGSSVGVAWDLGDALASLRAVR